MKLLVAVDGSDLALDAVRHALRLRDAGLNADLVLATVQEPTFLYEMVLPPSADVLERMSGASATAPWKALKRSCGPPQCPSSERSDRGIPRRH